MSVLWRKGRFKPGYRWRVLVHLKSRDGAYVPESTKEWRSSDHTHPVEFDELVIDHWFHLEQMSDRAWWMDVGGYHINVHLDGYGKPSVSIVQVSTPEEVAEHCEHTRRNP
jgi:hypothetical protein